MAKIVLGTAQFGLDYGINNTKGVPKDNELENIIKNARMHGIDILDTALDYGNAQDRLSQNDLNSFQIISKLKGATSYEDIVKKHSLILNQLKCKRIHGLLYHSPDELINKPIIWEWLQNLKINVRELKIGLSLYTVNELDHFLNAGIKPDIVQVPFNIFDREFETKFQILEDLNVEIYVRSVFMQGLFFIHPDQLPTKLNGLKEELSQLHQICKKHNVEIEQAALQFALRVKQIKGVVIGIESLNQLRKNLKHRESPIDGACYEQLRKIYSKVESPLNKPNQWKKIK